MQILEANIANYASFFVKKQSKVYVWFQRMLNSSQVETAEPFHRSIFHTQNAKIFKELEEVKFHGCHLASKFLTDSLDPMNAFSSFSEKVFLTFPVIVQQME